MSTCKKREAVLTCAINASFVHLPMHLFMCECVYVWVRVNVCVRECGCVRVRVRDGVYERVCVCVCGSMI